MNGQNLQIYFESDLLERVQITEPFGFDVATFTVLQDKDRIGRDVTYGNEEVSLRFERGFFERTDAEYALPDGTMTNLLSMGLPFILDEIADRGFEMQMKFIISNNGVDFVVGLLDAAKSTTDERTYFECKVVQDTNRMVYKRQEDTKIDVFLDKDLNGNTIEPLGTESILIRPTPIEQYAKWTSTGDPDSGFSVVFAQDIFPDVNVGVNPAQVLASGSTIENALAFISSKYALQDAAGDLFVPNGGNNFTYLQAKNEMTNVSIELTNINASTTQIIDDSIGNNVITGDGRTRLLITVGANYATPRLVIPVWEHLHNYPSFDPDAAVSPTSFAPVLIPLIQRGERVYIYFENSVEATFDNDTDDASYQVLNTVSTIDIEITATSTAISSVVKAVRYTGLFEQSAKSINGFPLIAPRYQEGGEFYPRFAINGWGLRGFDDRPFYVTWKDLTGNLQETRSDYQILPDAVFMAKWRDFYPDREIASFAHAYTLQDQPNRDLEIKFNPLYTAKTIDYKYRNYEKEDTADNTRRSIHTEAQFKFANSQVDSGKKIEVDIIVDPIKIEKLRKQAVTTDPNKATTDDDNIIVIDTVALDPGATGTFTANLLQRYNDSDQLQILNTANDGESNSAGFQWDSLGFEVGDVVTITVGQNAGTWSVYSITPTVLTLTVFGVAPMFEGTDILTFSYPLTNVSLVNRTSEDYDVITGLPMQFSNIDCSLKRNMLNYYGDYMATANLYHNAESISCTYFKNLSEDSNVTTQKSGELPITEFAAITPDQLPAPYLSAKTLSSRLVLTFEQAKAMVDAYNTVYDDGTIGGYVSVFDGNGIARKAYMTEMSETWKTGLMDFDGEIKYDG